jgi:hypothetical protein
MTEVDESVEMGVVDIQFDTLTRLKLMNPTIMSNKSDQVIRC